MEEMEAEEGMPMMGDDEGTDEATEELVPREGTRLKYVQTKIEQHAALMTWAFLFMNRKVVNV